MRLLTYAAIAILAGAVCQTLAIVFVAPIPWLYEITARFLPLNWTTPILASSIVSAPFGVVVTLVLSEGLRRTADDRG